MLSKNYTINKGDEWGFNVTFKNLTIAPENILFGLKTDFNQEEYDVIKTLKDGDIVPNGNLKYTVRLAPEDTANLPYENYNYDLRYVTDGRVKTPLGGRITITPTVFNKGN